MFVQGVCVCVCACAQLSGHVCSRVAVGDEDVRGS